MAEEQKWPEELDALTAAPKHHVLLLENEFVRVFDTKVAPGETVPLHTHRLHSVNYLLSWSDFVRRDGQGIVLVDSRRDSKVAKERVLWSAPLPPHTLENVGTQELRAISVELKGLVPG